MGKRIKTYETNLYYFAVDSLLKSNKDGRKQSKRDKKQMSAMSFFLDNLKAEDIATKFRKS